MDAASVSLRGLQPIYELAQCVLKDIVRTRTSPPSWTNPVINDMPMSHVQKIWVIQSILSAAESRHGRRSALSVQRLILRSKYDFDGLHFSERRRVLMHQHAQAETGLQFMLQTG